jgi:hypothetical protein
MLTKKKVMIALAILCVIVLSVFVSSQLHAFSCSAESSCGSCEVEEPCSSGGCVAAASGHWCLCEGWIWGANCAPEV